MEYVHGETVRDLMKRTGERDQDVPIGVALTFAAGAAAGLQHAHERTGHDGRPLGIVHRDVSPSNLMISFEGNVKMVDFGVGKAADRSVETVAGTVKGKIGYMAPEQCRGRTVDPRADLFSLGIVLWELLVGDRLFKRESDYDTMQAIAVEPSLPPSSRRPGIPPTVDALVLRLLAKSPADRFQSAAEMLESLETVAAGAGIPLSVSAVRRFMVEMFGQRPEPWHELRGTLDPVESPTVTGAPLLSRTPTVNAGAVRLDQLLDLRPRVTPGVAPPSVPLSSDPAPRRRSRWPLVALATIAGAAAAIAFGIAQRDESVAAMDVDASVSVDARTALADVVVPADANAQPDAAATVAPITRDDALKTAASEGRYADALATCAGSKRLASDHAALCTLAACHEKAGETARRWARAVKIADRGPVVDACRAFGVALVESGPRLAADKDHSRSRYV